MESGSVVKLKSGGPNMTASRTAGDTGRWLCQWFVQCSPDRPDDYCYCEGYFSEETLKLVSEP